MPWWKTKRKQLVKRVKHPLSLRISFQDLSGYELSQVLEAEQRLQASQVYFDISYIGNNRDWFLDWSLNRKSLVKKILQELEEKQVKMIREIQT